MLRGKELTLEVSQVALLVEAGGLETERVDDVVDLDLGILKTLVGLLSGSVGTSVYKRMYVRYEPVWNQWFVSLLRSSTIFCV